MLPFLETLATTICSLVISQGYCSIMRDKKYYSLGKYELRPAVKKLYHLRPKVSASRVSVAS